MTKYVFRAAFELDGDGYEFFASTPWDAIAKLCEERLGAGWRELPIERYIELRRELEAERKDAAA